jgi:DNA repair exonuclease SbcCD ATPase subunit
MIQLKKLVIENFKTIKNLEVEFDENDKHIVIVGPNGAGKSTIMQALRFLFTDTLDAPMSEYVNEDADNSFIGCEFYFDSIKYDYAIQLEYNKGKGTSSRTLIKSDREEPFHNSDAVLEIEKIINPKLTNYSAIVPQHENILVLSSGDSKERMAVFNLIIKNDKVLNAIDKISNDIFTSESELKDIQIELKTLESNTYSFLLEFTLPNIDDIKNKYDLLQKEKIEYDSLFKIYNDNAKNKSLYLELNNSKNSIENKLTLLNEDKSKYKIERVREIDTNAIEKIIKELEEKSIDNKSEIKKLNNELELCRLGKCPTCGTDYNHNPIEIENSIISLDNELKDIQVDISKQKLIIKEYDLKISLNKEVEKSIERVTKDITSYSSQLTDTINKIDNIKYDESIQAPTIYNELLLSDYKKEIDTYDVKVQQLQSIKEHNNSIKTEKEANDKKIKERNSQLEVVSRDLDQLKELRKYLKEFSADLLSESLKYVETKMNNKFQQVYSRCSVSFEPTKTSVNFKYTNGKRTRSTNLAGGFEKELIGLTFRLALSYIHNTGLFLLDEVDSAAAENMSIDLYSILAEEDFNHIICITHKEKTKEFLINNYHAKVIEFE